MVRAEKESWSRGKEREIENDTWKRIKRGRERVKGKNTVLMVHKTSTL